MLCSYCNQRNQRGAYRCYLCKNLLPRDPDATLPNEETVLHGRFQIIRLLGEGKTFCLYLAKDLRPPGNKVVMIKRIFQDPSLLQGELRRLAKGEGRLMHRLKHPMLPTLIDRIEDRGGSYCLVFDYIEGENLLQWLNRKRHLSLKEVLGIGMQICKILQFLHGQNPPIVARGIIPANFILHPSGQLYLTDLCLAREFKFSTHRQEKMKLGWPGYSPREQLVTGQPQSSPSSDVYSMAALLYHLIIRQSPEEDNFQFTFPLEGDLPLRLTSIHFNVLLAEMLNPDMHARPDIHTVAQHLQIIDDELKKDGSFIESLKYITWVATSMELIGRKRTTRSLHHFGKGLET